MLVCTWYEESTPNFSMHIWRLHDTMHLGMWPCCGHIQLHRQFLTSGTNWQVPHPFSNCKSWQWSFEVFNWEMRYKTYERPRRKKKSFFLSKHITNFVHYPTLDGWYILSRKANPMIMGIFITCYKACHVSLEYRCHVKESDHMGSTYFMYHHKTRILRY